MCPSASTWTACPPRRRPRSARRRRSPTGSGPAFARIAPSRSSGRSAAVTTPCAPVTVMHDVGAAQRLLTLRHEEPVEHRLAGARPDRSRRPRRSRRRCGSSPRRPCRTRRSRTPSRGWPFVDWFVRRMNDSSTLWPTACSFSANCLIGLSLITSTGSADRVAQRLEAHAAGGRLLGAAEQAVVRLLDEAGEQVAAVVEQQVGPCAHDLPEIAVVLGRILGRRAPTTRTPRAVR